MLFQSHWAALLIVSIGLLSGCASVLPKATVQTGDRLLVNYACRLEDNTLVAASQAPAQPIMDDQHNPLFLPARESGPRMIEAQAPQGATDDSVVLLAGPPSLDQEIQLQLARRLVGMPLPSRQKVALTTAPPEGLTKGSRYLRMARVRKRPKERRISLPTYLSRMGSPPEIGQAIQAPQGFRQIVQAISGEEIVTRLEIEPQEAYTTIFGTGRIEDAGSHFEIILDTQKGQLVRGRDRLGVIVSSDKRYFTVDWGHPFGGQKLYCDIDIQPYQQERAGK